MPRRASRTHSRYSQQAIKLLGHLIRTGRLERELSTVQLATRAGISRSLLYRIEKGDPTCSIGAVFETAAIVGVVLFEETRTNLTSHLTEFEKQLTLLPKSVRTRDAKVIDDF